MLMAEYYFRLPAITQLTISQQAALNEISQIAISGGPGTGKSVVSLYRHINNYNNGKKSLLLTYTTTLAKYLSACCRLQSASASNNVRSALSGRPKRFETFSEVIIDEAQDLDSDYYDRILQFKVSYGADDTQILYPEHSSCQADLRMRYPTNVVYTLDKNFRSTQSIMKFAKLAFPNAFVPMSVINSLENNIGNRPSLMITSGNSFGEPSNDKQNDAIKHIIEAFRSDTHNIAILVPFKNDVKAFRNILDDMAIHDFSYYYEDPYDFPNGCKSIKNIHLCTFKSAKGLEFDTVIIPNFDKMDNIIGKYCIEWSDYYVAVTRTRSNLYLISGRNFPNLISVVEITRL